jgi:hypothetical protein
MSRATDMANYWDAYQSTRRIAIIGMICGASGLVVSLAVAGIMACVLLAGS